MIFVITSVSGIVLFTVYILKHKTFYLLCFFLIFDYQRLGNMHMFDYYLNFRLSIQLWQLRVCLVKGGLAYVRLGSCAVLQLMFPCSPIST